MTQTMENIEWLPSHTIRASKAVGGLLFFSFLMFTLPFVGFFSTKAVLTYYYHIDSFINTVLSVVTAVIIVNAIIGVYAYKAFNEPELDEQGNVIEDKQKSKKQ